MSFDVSRISVCRKGSLSLITKEQNPEYENCYGGDFNLMLRGKPFTRNILLSPRESYDPKNKQSPKYDISAGETMELRHAGVVFEHIAEKTGQKVLNAVMDSGNDKTFFELTLFEDMGKKGQVYNVGKLVEKEKKANNSET